MISIVMRCEKRSQHARTMVWRYEGARNMVEEERYNSKERRKCKYEDVKSVKGRRKNESATRRKMEE